jgi:tetratricopeptide (TPR) repeat protein
LTDETGAASQERIAFLACTALTSEIRGGQGTLDTDAVRERLGQPDAAFTLRDLDARDDLAAQLEEVLAAGRGSIEEALLYVSARAMRAEGELLLLLDPEHPETGDALVDVLGALSEGLEGQVLALLDLRVDPDADAFEPTEVARLARAAQKETGAEVVIAVRKMSAVNELNATACSPFTKALLEALDGADPRTGATAADLYEAAREGPDVIGAVAAMTYGGPEDSFVVLRGDGSPPDATPVEPDEPAVAAEPSPEPPAVSPPPPVVEPEPPVPPVSAPPPPVVSSPPPAASVPPPSPSAPPPPTAKQVIAEADELAQSGNEEDALGRYRKALALAASADGNDADRAHIYVRIGEVKLRQGKAREAIASFEKGLGLDPSMPSADNVMKTLLGLYFGEKDHRAAYAIQQKILGRLDDPAETAVALVVFAQAWLEDVGDYLRAREALEQAVALAPTDLRAVQLLYDLAKREGRTDDALGLRRRLADLESGDAPRAAQLLALAKELVKEHKREDEALDVLEAALEANPSQLEPLALLSELLAERQEWSELEGTYRRMLERLARIEDADLRSGIEHEIGRRLGVLLEDHLDDPPGALEAFEVAVRAHPREPVVRAKAAALAQATGELDRAIGHLVASASLEPRRTEIHRALFDLFMRTERVERAADVAAVLARLGAASDRARAVLGAQVVAERPKGALGEEDWPILRAGVEPGVEESMVEPVADIFRAAGGALAAAMTDVARRAGKLPRLDESQMVDPETSTVTAARCLAWAAKALSVPVPRVYLDEASTLAMTPALRELATTVVGAGALRGRSLGELSFLAGHHLTLQRREHRLVRLCADIDDLAACFVTAVVAAVPDTPIPERLRRLVDLLLPGVREHLEEDDEAALEEAVIAFDAAGARADIGLFVRAVERAAIRAGTLLAGPLAVALDTARTLPGDDEEAEERENEIYAFAVSDIANQLRQKLGLYE